jgi:hypothetical protein
MMLIPGVFSFLAPIAGVTWIAINRQRLIMAALVIISALCLAGDYAALNNGYGIIGVAVMTAVGYSILGLSYSDGGDSFGRPEKESIPFHDPHILPFAVMIVVLAAMEWLIPIGGRTEQVLCANCCPHGSPDDCARPSFWLTNRTAN